MGQPPSCQLVPHVALLVPMDRRDQTDLELLYKVFSLLSWLGWYILASASYKGGATAMAFGQVQGGIRGAPPLPQALTHLKEAEQQRHSTDMGKGYPRASRMVILTRASLGPPPAPRTSTSTSHLFTMKRNGEGSRGHVVGSKSLGLGDVPSSEPIGPQPPCAVKGLWDPRRMEQLGGGNSNPASWVPGALGAWGLSHYTLTTNFWVASLPT